MLIVPLEVIVPPVSPVPALILVTVPGAFVVTHDSDASGYHALPSQYSSFTVGNVNGLMSEIKKLPSLVTDFFLIFTGFLGAIIVSDHPGYK